MAMDAASDIELHSLAASDMPSDASVAVMIRQVNRLKSGIDAKLAEFSILDRSVLKAVLADHLIEDYEVQRFTRAAAVRVRHNTG